jgi:peptidylprolyl isomerase
VLRINSIKNKVPFRLIGENMKKWLASLTFGCLLPITTIAASGSTNDTTQQVSKETDTHLISEALGHLISKNLANLSPEFDIESVIKGLKDAMGGISSPLTEEQTIEAIQKIQEKTFQKLATENLKEAQDFLDLNAKKENVISLESGKIQYVTNHAGKGAIVEASSNPLIKYKGKFLNGQVFGESELGETISLPDTFPGFSKALVGMKEGEVRTIYIHPELGYGTSGMLPPNSLLTFEVEIIKSHVADDKLEASDNFLDADDLQFSQSLK